MSTEDLIFVGALPVEQRTAAEQWCLKHVKPLVDDIPDDDLIPIIRKIERDGAITLCRSKVN